ncbi:unnamed protein product, partial [Scytosiphon promiscuus]
LLFVTLTSSLRITGRLSVPLIDAGRWISPPVETRVRHKRGYLSHHITPTASHILHSCRSHLLVGRLTSLATTTKPKPAHHENEDNVNIESCDDGFERGGGVAACAAREHVDDLDGRHGPERSGASSSSVQPGTTGGRNHGAQRPGRLSSRSSRTSDTTRSLCFTSSRCRTTRSASSPPRRCKSSSPTPAGPTTTLSTSSTGSSAAAMSSSSTATRR